MNTWKMLIFDLDGLLVNTEMMHWRAYTQACAKVGVSMDWDFDSYFQTASVSETGVKTRLAIEHPDLFQKVTWDQLYDIKQKALLSLLDSEPVPLMPGVVEIVERAHRNKVLMACVTHSRRSFVEAIRLQHPILSSIAAWYPRETYTNPKPAPDGYTKAVLDANLFPEQVIGFEDSLRGLQAEVQAGILPVLVSKDRKTQQAAAAYPSVLMFPTLHDVIAYPPFAPLFA